MNTTSYQDFHITDGILHAYTGRDEQITVPDNVHTIGEGAFKACVSLKKVYLPDCLCHILSGAFKGCRRLESIHIPAGVTTIGSYAFHRCHALKSIALPPSVKELGDCVFLYCDSLTRADLPGVLHMGKQVFVNDVFLQQITISPHLQESCICDVFTGCSRLSSISLFCGQTYSFPNAVEAIAGNLELPFLVHAIAADVLRMMELDGRCLVKFLTNLKHVEIPEGIEKIGKSCFFDKRGILSVSFPASLKEIESRAFRNCISLESVSFENDRVRIHEDAFKNCSLLKKIRTSDGHTHSIEGIANLPADGLARTIQKQVLGNFCIGGTILFRYLGDESRVLVPDGITCIAENAFANKESIDRIILPDSLEEIGEGAFCGCLLLQTIPLPKNLARIGAGAFEHCVKLLSVLLPEKLKRLEAKVFKHCHKLKEIGFGTELEEIGEQAFYGCRSLKEVHFPKSLSLIGAMAFFRCEGLREICLLPNLAHVGNLAFSQSGIRRARLGGSGKNYGSDLFFGCLFLHTIILESGVCHIPDKLAYGCTSLKKVIFPEPLVKADNAFALRFVGRNVWEHTPYLKCWRGKYLEIYGNTGAENTQSFGDFKTENIQVFEGSITGNADEIFWDGRSLRGEVHLSKNIRIIAGGAFYGNAQITAVYIPESITWIGAAAFKGCSCLRRVVWAAKAEIAETEVFSGCTSLEIINVSDTCQISPVHWLHIKERAFYRCHRLREIALDKVQTIGKEAFGECYALPVFQPLFYQEAKHLTWAGEQVFARINAGTPFSCSVVNNILISGHGFTGQVRLPKGITAIAPYAFSGNQEITHLILPKSLRIIGEGAFWGCKRLAGVDFFNTDSENLDSACACSANADSAHEVFSSALLIIGARAFEKCTALSEICIFACRVGTRAFACCTALKKVRLSGLSVLENRLFEHCTSLEEYQCLPFPDVSGSQASSVKIGDYCFSGCKSLKTFDFSSVREIGSYAFLNCDGLENISFDDHTLLSPHAFEDCGRLKEIQLAGSLGSVRLCAYALSGCTALKRVIQKGKVWALHAYRDCLADDLPETVRLMFYSAFSCFSIEQEEILCAYRGTGRIIHIPYGIRKIEAEVFRDVLMLEQVEIPETVTDIGARAFHQTAWMEKMRRQNPMVTVHSMLLDGSSCTGEVTIPQSIRQICGWAFAGGMGITKLRFLSDRVKVGAYAFRNCIYLREIELADKTRIKFHGIADRKRELAPLPMQVVTDSLNCFKTDEDDRLVECTGNISRLLLAHGITAIGDRVFQDANLLTEITLPPTVTAIGKSAFSGCKWLKTVRQAQGVTAIGERAFSGCGVLETVELSSALAFIGKRAFENCTSLKEILLPEGLEEIPERAFFRCHSLKSITLPSSLKRIGREAFAFCKNLEIKALPEHVLVEERAFIGSRGRVFASQQKKGGGIE